MRILRLKEWFILMGNTGCSVLNTLSPGKVRIIYFLFHFIAGFKGEIYFVDNYWTVS